MTGRVRWMPAYLLAHITPVLASTCVWIIVCAMQPLVIMIGPALAILTVSVRSKRWVIRLRCGGRAATDAERDVRAVVAGYRLAWRLAVAVGGRFLDVTGLRAAWALVWGLRPVIVVTAVVQQAATDQWEVTVGCTAFGVLTYTTPFLTQRWRRCAVELALAGPREALRDR